MVAYALTIHKCQDMSLDRCEIHLTDCFESEMAHVALSRARSLRGLQIVGWNPKLVKADKTVRKFYEGI
jgi:ATP-dependent DNA helicase PIF1